MASHFGAWIGIYPVSPDFPFALFPVPKVRPVKVSQKVYDSLKASLDFRTSCLDFLLSRKGSSLRSEAGLIALCKLSVRHLGETQVSLKGLKQ